MYSTTFTVEKLKGKLYRVTAGNVFIDNLELDISWDRTFKFKHFHTEKYPIWSNDKVKEAINREIYLTEKRKSKMSNSLEDVQAQINQLDEDDRSQLTDGYHSFEELYSHRNTLFMCVINMITLGVSIPNFGVRTFKSRKNFDGTAYDGWFLAGYINHNLEVSEQVTYHLPNNYWDKLIVNEIYDDNKECSYTFDGHTPQDVLDRLQERFSVNIKE